MGYSREEQETVMRYDSLERKWMAYSAYPPHIRKIKNLAEEIRSEELDENGNTISIYAVLGENFVKISKPKQLSEEQRQKAGERMRKMRQKQESR